MITSLKCTSNDYQIILSPFPVFTLLSKSAPFISWPFFDTINFVNVNLEFPIVFGKEFLFVGFVFFFFSFSKFFHALLKKCHVKVLTSWYALYCFFQLDTSLTRRSFISNTFLYSSVKDENLAFTSFPLFCPPLLLQFLCRVYIYSEESLSHL